MVPKDNEPHQTATNAQWEMAKWADRSNTFQGTAQQYAQLQKDMSSGQGQKSQAAQNSASVPYVGSTTEHKSPQEIVNSTDPGVGPSTKSYTLMLVGKTQVYVDQQTGATSVTIAVGAKTVLPNNTNKYDQKEADQRTRIISATVEADRQAKQVASQTFKDSASFKGAVENRVYRVLWTENRRVIFDTDIANPR